MKNLLNHFYLTDAWKKRLAIGTAVLVLGVAFAVGTAVKKNQEKPLEKTQKEESGEIAESAFPTDGTLYAVHVSGAVRNGDRVYYLAAGSRIADAVEAAGGVTGEADLSQVNLAQYLSDAQKIYIPRQGEDFVVTEAKNGIESGPDGIIDSPNYDDYGRLNINGANAEELCTLPGIGQAYAARIIEYRESFGLFSSVEELLNVSGIGEKTLDRIRNFIYV